MENQRNGFWYFLAAKSIESESAMVFRKKFIHWLNAEPKSGIMDTIFLDKKVRDSEASPGDDVIFYAMTSRGFDPLAGHTISISSRISTTRAARP